MCENNECVWVSGKKVQDMNLANCKGEFGPADLTFPCFSIVQPQKGDVCLSCFQIYGEDKGTLNQDLVKLEQVLKGLSS